MSFLGTFLQLIVKVLLWFLSVQAELGSNIIVIIACNNGFVSMQALHSASYHHFYIFRSVDKYGNSKGPGERSGLAREDS